MYNEIELYKHTYVFMILELITIHLTKPASSVTNQGQSIVFAFLVFLRVPDSTSMCCPDAHKQRFVALVAVGVFELKSWFQIFTHKQTTISKLNQGYISSKYYHPSKCRWPAEKKNIRVDWGKLVTCWVRPVWIISFHICQVTFLQDSASPARNLSDRWPSHPQSCMMKYGPKVCIYTYCI